jgi:hypothetical protein
MLPAGNIDAAYQSVLHLVLVYLCLTAMHSLPGFSSPATGHFPREGIQRQEENMFDKTKKQIIEPAVNAIRLAFAALLVAIAALALAVFR